MNFNRGDQDDKRLAIQLRDFYLQARKLLDDDLLVQLQNLLPPEAVHDTPSIFKWLRQSFTLLARKSSGSSNIYQPMIQKLQGEVRQHIRIQQEMKIYVDSLQTKISQSKAAVSRTISENASLRKINEELMAKMANRQNKQNYQSNNPSRPLSRTNSNEKLLRSRKSQKSLGTDRPVERQFDKGRITSILNDKIGRRKIGVVTRKQSCQRIMPKGKLL